MNWLKEVARRTREAFAKRAHDGAEGAFVADFFRSFLPVRYSLGKGKLAACDDERKPLLSGELEAVIYDEQHKEWRP